jgi:hypothetical protein
MKPGALIGYNQLDESVTSIVFLFCRVWITYQRKHQILLKASSANLALRK